MQLEQAFDVEAPIDRVWQALIDVEHVAPCLPGASITGRGEDGSYEGAFTVKIGPTTASYTGKLEMTEVDAGSHRATMSAQGSDRRGQGGASATIVSELTETGSGSTRVAVNTDYRITGRLARFGRGGMIEDISEKLLRQFAQNLQASLLTPADAPVVPPPAAAPDATAAGGPPAAAAETEQLPPEVLAPPVTADESPFPGATPSPPPAAPLDLGGLLGGALLERARRNPLPLIAGVLLLLALLRGRRR